MYIYIRVDNFILVAMRAKFGFTLSTAPRPQSSGPQKNDGNRPKNNQTRSTNNPISWKEHHLILIGQSRKRLFTQSGCSRSYTMLSERRRRPDCSSVSTSLLSISNPIVSDQMNRCIAVEKTALSVFWLCVSDRPQHIMMMLLFTTGVKTWVEAPTGL